MKLFPLEELELDKDRCDDVEAEAEADADAAAAAAMANKTAAISGLVAFEFTLVPTTKT
jgi:hypothetical protein